MHYLTKKYLEKSKFKHVYKYVQGTRTIFVGKIAQYGFHVTCDDETEAAKKVDRFLISIGKDPVNLFKKA